MANVTVTESEAVENNALETVKDEASCCGGAAPRNSNACCARDAEAKESGAAGCGCDAKTSVAKSPCC